MLKLKRRMTTVLVSCGVLVGLAIGIIAHRVASNAEDHRIREEFFTVLESKVANFQLEMTACLETLHAVRGLFESSEQVTRKEFDSFCSELIVRHQAIQALEWVPAIPADASALHERAVRADGIADYRIWPSEISDGPLKTLVRYPTVFICPMEGNQAALGYDLSTDPTRRNALALAAATNRVVMTQPLALLQCEGAQGVLVCLPVPSAEGHLETPDAKDFVVMVLRISDSVAETLLGDRRDDVQFEIIDLAPEGTMPLYTSCADCDVDSVDEHMHIDLNLAERAWCIRGYPQPAFFEARTTIAPILLGAGSSLLWGCLLTLSLGVGRQLREAGERPQREVLSSVMGSVVEGVVVADLNGSLLAVNRRARNLVGNLKRGSSLQKWASEILWYRRDGFTPYQPEELPLVRALQGQETPETEILLRSPQTPNGVWLSVTAAPVLNQHGTRRGAVMVLRDITASKESMAVLERMSRALEQTGDGVFVSSRSGIIEYANHGMEQLTGRSLDTLLGLEVVHVVPEDIAKAPNPGGIEAKSGKSHFALQCGDKRTLVEHMVTPMYDARGEVTHFVWALRDRTDALRQQEQDTEMRLAADVQARLYPRRPPEIPGLDVSGVVFPASATCGDYFDYLDLPEGRFGMVIGDVSGHGLGPALVMSETRTLIRTLGSLTADPGEIFARANKALHRDLEDHRFVTMLLAALDPKSGVLTYCNAGHPSGYVMTRDGTVRCELGATALPLGVLADAEYKSITCTRVQPGDLILLLTDGVLECQAHDGSDVEPECLLSVVREHRGESASEIVHAIHDTICGQARTGPQEDDITVVVVKVL